METESHGYYRYPTVRDQRVVFVAEDDLWEVPLTGGLARRVTAGWGSAGRPHLSPDGQWIAFVGKEEGDTEVYVMPAHGGPLRRLTYLGAGVQVVGWDPDGYIVFSTYQGKPFLSWRTLFRIAVGGGEPEPLPFGPAVAISWGPQGGIVLGRPTTEASHWKRYRGGTRGVLWIDESGTGAFERFALDGSVVNPLWIHHRIYFVADHEGIGNLYSIRPDGTDLKRHTHHTEYYVRNPATDGHTIVYHAGGRLYRWDPETETGAEIPVDYPGQKTQQELKHVEAAEYWTEYRLTPDGDQILLTTRGKLFQLAPFEGPVRPLGQPQGVRYRLGQYVADGDLLVLSDEGGEDGIEMRRPHAFGEDVTHIPGDYGIVIEMTGSPDGAWIALANERQELWLINRSSLETRRIFHSRHGRIQGIDWSPDSQWLAYAAPIVSGPEDPTANARTAIFIYEVAGDTSRQVTRPVLSDRRPVFDPHGRYLYFLSRRLYAPVWDNMKFDLGFPKGEIPCLITLTRDLTSPFMPEPRPMTDNEPASTGTEPLSVTIDFEGIDERVLQFPVAEGLFLDLQAGPQHVFWTTVEPDGQEDDDWFIGAPATRATLYRYDLKELKAEVVMERMTSFQLSGNRKVLAIRAGRTLRVVKATDKVETKDDKPGRTSGIVDLNRVRVVVDPPAEWAQMLREAWRLMRELFWTANMADVDWDQVYHKYARLLPRIATRGELSDLLWEMQGELGTSHAYEMGGEYRSEPNHRMGFLGADLAWDAEAQGYRIRHLVHGDSWNPDHHSPLLAPGLNISPGDVILAINGQPLGPDLPPGKRLIDQARREVAITVQQRNHPEPRTVRVRPLAKETPARYREWVETNRQRVHERTHGRVGYIHIPNMGSQGFAEFHRGYLAEYDREGLIIDVRFNGGGIVSPLLLEMLNRKRIAFTRTRYGHVEPYPYQAPRGAMVALTNEHAGSDGDIFSHAFKLMGLGPLVGTRTWGGVIGINVRYHLVDGSITTQPEEAFWFKDVGWGVENYGTDPDIEVPYRPQDAMAGVDPQLEQAIDVVLELLQRYEPVIPHFQPVPSRSVSPLKD